MNLERRLRFSRRSIKNDTVHNNKSTAGFSRGGACVHHGTSYDRTFTVNIDPDAPPGPIVFQIIGTTPAAECSDLVTVTVVEITNAMNIQTVRGTTLDDQVLNGTGAQLQAEVDLGGQAVTYYLRWTFVGTVSSWQGPFSASPSGIYNLAIPTDQTHTLNEQLQVQMRIGTDGPICDPFTRDMKVFFDVDGITDSHNYSGGAPDANWFRHWGFDWDDACSTYAATASVLYFGVGVTFVHGGPGGAGQTGAYNGNLDPPIITLYDAAHGAESENFQSPAMSYTDSQGNQVNAPLGAITIAFDKSGIDLVNHTVTHEVKHVHVDVRWDPVLNGEWFRAYGPYGQWLCDDGDGNLDPGEHDFDCDELPNVVEDAIPGLRWNAADTYPGALFYIDGDDEEVWCELEALSAPSGNSGNDWAFEGKQSTPNN